MAMNTLELTVFDSALQQAVTEMDIALERAAFSPVISEARDRSNGIYGRDDGWMIAQGETALPIFVGIMSDTVNVAIERVNPLSDGDVVIINDPYSCGSHLMDVRLVTPFFSDGELVAYLANSAHWADIGGATPGGFGASATEIHAEGTRLPGVRISQAGVINQDLLSVILANVRAPEERLGDLLAQLGALSVGCQRMREIVDRWGADFFLEATEELRRRSEAQVRKIISSFPDGRYEVEDYLDGDGIEDSPLRIRVVIEVAEDELTVDFSGSSPTCAGPLNAGRTSTAAAVLIAFKHAFPATGSNAGAFAPIRVRIPDGCFLAAEYPSPVSGSGSEVPQRVVDVVLQGLAKIDSELAFGCPFGTSANLTLSGFNGNANAHYIMYFFAGGGYGGFADGDGMSNGCSAISLAPTTPIEILEQRYPVRFDYYRLREGSAGDGQFRGGLGVEYSFSLTGEEAFCSVMMDRGKTGPPGVLGGLKAASSEVTLGINGRTRQLAALTKEGRIPMANGDWIAVATPGGGGYGPPDARSRDLIERDLARGYVMQGHDPASS
jgi:N-methylhydantoinase B